MRDSTNGEPCDEEFEDEDRDIDSLDQGYLAARNNDEFQLGAFEITGDVMDAESDSVVTPDACAAEDSSSFFGEETDADRFLTAVICVRERIGERADSLCETLDRGGRVARTMSSVVPLVALAVVWAADFLGFLSSCAVRVAVPSIIFLQIAAFVASFFLLIASLFARFISGIASDITSLFGCIVSDSTE
jgi:hypothetical protein